MKMKTMKKVYQKPTVCVVELQQQPHLLAGSDPYPGKLGYVPGFDKDDMNQLA